MKSWEKFLRVIFALIILLTVFFSYFMIFDYGAISRRLIMVYREDWFFYFFTTICALTALFALFYIIRAAVAPSVKDYLVDEDKEGKLLITKSAIESNVRSAANSFSAVRETRSDIDIINGDDPKIKASLKCAVPGGTDLKGLGENIKDRVKLSLENFTGYTVESVNVEFHDFNNNREKSKVV